MNNKQKLSIVVLMMFLTNFLNATTTLNSPPGSKIKDDNHTLTFEQNYLLKKITLNSYNSAYTVEIFDAKGNTVKKMTIENNSKLEIPTAKIKPGRYFLRYVGKNKKNNSVKSIIIK